MSGKERRKGQRGEAEVARIYREAGYTVRGLEGGGDHNIVREPGSGVRFHSEVKRQEVARPWLWREQARAEAPPGTIPLVHFRRSASPWVVMLDLADFIALIDRVASTGHQTDAGSG